MNILLLISIVYVICFFTFLICCAITNLTLKDKYIFIPLLLLSLAMAYIAFCWNPTDTSADLNRHFFSYEALSGKMGDLTQKAFLGEKLAAGLFIWTGIFYIAIGLGNPHYIPFFMVFINYLFFALSCKTICKYYKVDGYKFLFFLIIKIGLVSWFHIFSGLRNTCAFSILTYGIILSCIDRKKNNRRIYICCAIAAMIHPSSWIVILFFIFHKYIKNKKMLYFILALWSYFSLIIVKFFSLIPISVVQFISNKLLFYYGSSIALEWRIFSVCLVFVLIMCLQFYFINNNSLNHNNTFENNYFDFLEMIFFFLIGSTLLPTMLMRFTYLIGYMFLPIVCISNKYLRKSDYFIFNVGEGALGLFMCAYNWVALTSHMYLR